jgi:hypothetical protein
MTQQVLSYSTNTKPGYLDDDYTLYDDGSVLHEYDEHPTRSNLTRNLTVNGLRPEVKVRLYEAAKDEDKERVKQLLKLD